MTFMAHRGLAIFLMIFTFILFTAGVTIPMFGGLGYYWLLLPALVTGIASAYFFKTQH